jgi:hypothetical protein
MLLKEGNTSQQPNPRMKEAAESVDLQPPSEKIYRVFLTSVDIKKILITFLIAITVL